MTMTIKVHPTGWRILLKPKKSPSKSDGGILYAEETQEINQMSTVICEVIELGPLAYTEERHGDPWVKVGDFVLIERFAGMKFNYRNAEYRIMNDEEIVGITENPDGISIK